MSYVLSGVHAASRSGKAEKVLEFLSKGTDVNKPDVSGCTPAMWACWGGHVDLLGVLCEHGADLECANSVGTRAIHWACWSGSVEVLKALLKKGVNIDVCDEQDGAPLHYVAKKGVPELCTLLLKAGASVDVRSSSSMTPLHVACHSNRKDVARMLIFKRADVNAVDKGGRTPLHYACLKNHTTIVRLLLDWKADAQALDARGKSPETLVGQSACRKDKPLGEEVLAMLKEANRHSAETAPKSAEKDSNPKPAEDGPVGPKEEEQVPEVATRNEESLTPAAATGTPDNAAKYQKKRSVKNLLGALMGSGSGSGDSFMRSSPRRLSSSSISVPEGVETEVPLQQLSQPAGRKRKGSAASAGASASLREIHVNASEEDVALQPSSSKLSVSPRLNGSLGSPLSYSSALMEPVASDDEGDDNDDQEVAFEMAIEKMIGDLEDLSEQVESLQADHITNEDILMNMVKRVTQLEAAVAKTAGEGGRKANSSTVSAGSNPISEDATAKAVHAKDDEIEALRKANKNTRLRLDDQEAEFKHFMERLHALEESQKKAAGCNCAIQ